MTWTPEKLSQFQAHFGLSDRQLGEALNISTRLIWMYRNKHADLERISAPLTGYLEAIRAGKIREAQKMIEYYNSFKVD